MRSTASAQAAVFSLPPQIVPVSAGPAQAIWWGPIAVHSGWVYMASTCIINRGTWYEGDVWCPLAGVYRVPVMGGQLELFTPLVSTIRLVASVVVTDDVLVWASVDSSLTTTSFYAAPNAPNAAGAVLFTTNEQLHSLAVGTGYAFVCTNAALHQVSLATGEDTVLAKSGCHSLELVGNQLWRLGAMGTPDQFHLQELTVQP